MIIKIVNQKEKRRYIQNKIIVEYNGEVFSFNSTHQSVLLLDTLRRIVVRCIEYTGYNIKSENRDSPSIDGKSQY